jgi:hypothetical protein
MIYIRAKNFNSPEKKEDEAANEPLFFLLFKA